jgi:hypothetical protein
LGTPSGIRNWSRDTAPALAILLATVVFSLFHKDSVSLTAWAVCKAPFRFLRFVFFLTIPLYALPKIYNFIVQRKASSLVRVDQKEGLRIHLVKHWILRPFQGIGIGLLFGTKLIAVLQLIAVSGISTSLLIPEGHFQIGRFFIITIITILISLLLGTLWTLDDMGVRYFNRRDEELKMIGKYAGTLMPVIFGFYGIGNFLASYTITEAAFLVGKIAVVLYPPLAVFVVLHTYFVRRRTGIFMKSELKKSHISLEQ